jgi:hypothetical protein
MATTTKKEQAMSTWYYETTTEVRELLSLLQELELIGFRYQDEFNNPWTDEDWDRDSTRIEEIMTIAKSNGCIYKFSNAYGVDMFIYPAIDDDGNQVMLDPTESIENDPLIVDEWELKRLKEMAA